MASQSASIPVQRAAETPGPRVLTQTGFKMADAIDPRLISALMETPELSPRVIEQYLNAGKVNQLLGMANSDADMLAIKGAMDAKRLAYSRDTAAGPSPRYGGIYGSSAQPQASVWGVLPPTQGPQSTFQGGPTLLRQNLQ